MADQNADTMQAEVFSGVPQHETFCRMAELAPANRMEPSTTPAPWPLGMQVALPETYKFEGRERKTTDLLESTDTAALLVLKDGAIIHEYYALTGGVDVPWISMSVAKSYISALVGIALKEGHIRSIDEPISDYIAVNPGSAYDGVSIRNVLQMSSGARWNEDYADKSSEIFALSAVMAGVGTLDDFVANMVRQGEPGQVCRYNSGDTQALGALLVRATGRSVSSYMQEKLCEPLGVVGASHWLVDSTGREMTFAGLNMTARDFARFGELYRKGGLWNGQQIVPAAWVQASIRADGAHVQPGRPIVGTHTFDMGYGYQWWLPGGGQGDFSAIGVYNQFIYVSPAHGVVIVKLSANRHYGTVDDESANRDHENATFLQQIAQVI